MADNNQTLDVFGVTSSAGLRMSQYQLSLDPQTNALGFSFNAVLVGVAQIIFWVYKFVCAFIIWIVNLAASFGWLSYVRDGLNTIAIPLQRLIEDSNLIKFLVAIAAAVAAVALMRGRTASGLTEMATSALILALIGGLLSNPVKLITGPDGIVMKAHDAGVEIATSVSGGKSDNAGAKLADMFVELPTQLINFGQALPASCTQQWHAALAGGPRPGDAPEVRQAVEACATSLDGTSALGTAIVLSPSVLALMLFALVLAVGLLVCGLIACKDTLKLLWAAPRAIAPGDGRTEFFRTAASAVFAAVGVLVLLVMLTIQMELLQLVFLQATKPSADGGGGLNPIVAFFLIDLLVAIGGVMLLMYLLNNRKKAKAAAERLKRGLSPGGGGAQARGPSVLSSVRRGATTYGQWKLGRSMLAANRPGAGGSGPGSSPGSSVEGGGAGGAGAGAPAPQRSRAARAARVGAKVAVTAGKVALGASIGAPVAVPRWTSAAMSAASRQKKTLQDKMSATKQNVSTKVGEKAAAVDAYGREYAHNVAAVGAFAGRAAHAAGRAAAAGRPTTPEMTPQHPGPNTSMPPGPARGAKGKRPKPGEFTHQAPVPDPFESGRRSKPGTPPRTSVPTTAPSSASTSSSTTSPSTPPSPAPPSAKAPPKPGTAGPPEQPRQVQTRQAQERVSALKTRLKQQPRTPGRLP